MYICAAEETGKNSSLGRSSHFISARKLFTDRAEKKSSIFCNRNTIELIVQHDQMDTKSRRIQYEITTEIKTEIKKISQILSHLSADISSFEVIIVKGEVSPPQKLSFYFKILDQTFSEDKKEQKRVQKNYLPSQATNLRINKTKPESNTLFYFIAVSGTTWEDYLNLFLNTKMKMKLSIQRKIYNAKEEKK